MSLIFPAGVARQPEEEPTRRHRPPALCGLCCRQPFGGTSEGGEWRKERATCRAEGEGNREKTTRETRGGGRDKERTLSAAEGERDGSKERGAFRSAQGERGGKTAFHAPEGEGRHTTTACFGHPSERQQIKQQSPKEGEAWGTLIILQRLLSSRPATSVRAAAIARTARETEARSTGEGEGERGGGGGSSTSRCQSHAL